MRHTAACARAQVGHGGKAGIEVHGRDYAEMRARCKTSQSFANPMFTLGAIKFETYAINQALEGW
jgi:hypothetical protein